MAPKRPGTPTLCCAIAVGLFLVYSSNGRCIGSGDTAPTALLAAAIARGDGFVLDRYAPIVARGGGLPYWATVRRGHILSLYPVAPAVVAAPFTWAQLRILDLVWPTWTRSELPVVLFLAKNSAAALASLFGVACFVLFSRLGYARERWAALVAATLGSEMWVVGSQSLWQHGPSALALAVGILAASGAPTARRSVIAGLAGGTVFACRIVSSVYVVPLVVWLVMRRPRALGWFLLGMLPLVGLTLAYNLYWFDDWQGGIVVLEAMKPYTHAVAGRWTEDLTSGLAGTLVSPARGLFVYEPWAAVALAMAPLHWRGHAAGSPFVALLALSLLPSGLLLGAYSTWWGGWSFGPRFWTDATPILAILLAAALVEARQRGAIFRGAIYASVGVAVAIQAVGSVCYPSSWNAHPANVDQAPGRLWSWRDTEVSRCVREGPHPGAHDPLSPAALQSAFGIARPPGTP